MLRKRRTPLLLTVKVELDLIHDLMPLNIGKLCLKIITKDPERTQIGFLPLMAGCCDGQFLDAYSEMGECCKQTMAAKYRSTLIAIVAS
jgi:hypothetical protein